MATTVQRTALPSMREILTAVFKERQKILWSAGATMLVAVGVAFSMTPQYDADSSLMVLLGPEYTVRGEAGAQNVGGGTLDRDQILKSEIEILNSGQLHEATIRQIGLDRLYPAMGDPTDLVGRVKAGLKRSIKGLMGMPMVGRGTVDPVRAASAQFDEALDVSASKERGVLDVSFRHPDAQVAADVVNTLVKLYIQRRKEIYSDVQSSVLEGELKALRQQLDAADQQLAQFKASNNISNYDTERDILLHQHGDLSKDALDTESQIAQLKQRLAALTSQLAATPTDVTAYSDTNIDQRVSSITTALNDLKGKQTALLANYRSDSRPVQELARQIEQRQDELDRLRQDKSVSNFRIQRNPVHDTIEIDRLKAESDLDAAEARHNAVALQITDLNARITQLNTDEEQLQRLTRQRSVTEDNYRALTKVVDDRRVVEDIDARSAANVRVIQSAEVPLTAKSSTSIILVSGLLLSLLVGGLVALAAEILRRGFISPEKLERTLGVPVLASVPETPWRPTPAPRWGGVAAAPAES